MWSGRMIKKNGRFFHNIVIRVCDTVLSNQYNRDQLAQPRDLSLYSFLFPGFFFNTPHLR